MKSRHDHLVSEVAQLRGQLELAAREATGANEALLQAAERNSEQRKHTAVEAGRSGTYAEPSALNLVYCCMASRRKSRSSGGSPLMSILAGRKLISACMCG